MGVHQSNPGPVRGDLMVAQGEPQGETLGEKMERWTFATGRTNRATQDLANGCGM